MNAGEKRKEITLFQITVGRLGIPPEPEAIFALNPTEPCRYTREDCTIAKDAPLRNWPEECFIKRQRFADSGGGGAKLPRRRNSKETDCGVASRFRLSDRFDTTSALNSDWIKSFE